MAEEGNNQVMFLWTEVAAIEDHEGGTLIHLKSGQSFIEQSPYEETRNTFALVAGRAKHMTLTMRYGSPVRFAANKIVFISKAMENDCAIIHVEGSDEGFMTKESYDDALIKWAGCDHD